MSLPFKLEELEAMAYESKKQKQNQKQKRAGNKENVGVLFKTSLSSSELICRVCSTCVCFSQPLEQESSICTYALAKGWEIAAKALKLKP